MRLMALGAMLGDGDRMAVALRAQMRSHTLPLVQDLYRSRCRPHLHQLMHLAQHHIQFVAPTLGESNQFLPEKDSPGWPAADSRGSVDGGKVTAASGVETGRG